MRAQPVQLEIQRASCPLLIGWSLKKPPLVAQLQHIVPNLYYRQAVHASMYGTKLLLIWYMIGLEYDLKPSNFCLLMD